jgi:DNA-binding response OmpR family regulator
MQETEKKKILIIEDEKPLAHALLLKLSHEGFLVTTTDSGQKGLEYLAGEHFDLVLTDLILPGVDGFKVLETMKEQGLNVPVIVITNLNQEEDKKRAFDLGATGLFVKSNSPISLIVEGVKNRIQPTSATDVIESENSQSQIAPSQESATSATLEKPVLQSSV